jgi:hypothetical protein
MQFSAPGDRARVLIDDLSRAPEGAHVPTSAVAEAGLEALTIDPDTLSDALGIDAQHALDDFAHGTDEVLLLAAGLRQPEGAVMPALDARRLLLALFAVSPDYPLAQVALAVFTGRE